MTLEIYPAIDLRGGRCVRLRQGDYGQEIIFGHDPAEMAGHWVRHGAHRLHLVDLDGARSGKPGNVNSIRDILAAVDVPCQVGGGIRDEASIVQWLEMGVWRVVIGTKAFKDPAWFREMCRKYPQRLILGIDGRDGQVATEGWLEQSSTKATDLAAQFAEEPIAAIICTDIATDGMLSGPNVPEMIAMRDAVHHPVIASGGVTTVEDVRVLAEANLHGCIIGRALYEGRIDLFDALTVAGDDPPSERVADARDF
jgi:phosphoribosylformimino-5-aminoimidazole carboxamide ribotide isomerase